MADAPTTSPAAKLAGALEHLSPDDRQQVVAWLLSGPGVRTWHGFEFRRHVTGVLPSREESQLVGIRLPSASHERLRDWCAEHGFSMAAVVRGRVDRFLEGQTPEKA
jgi:hypothetical protein